MFIVVSALNPDPLYKQVTDQIKEAIAAGRLKPGDKLPSIREMAGELKISEITIKRAYTDLEKGGYIYTRAGMGSFISPIEKEKLRREKMEEISSELSKLLKKCGRFKITAEDLVALIKTIKEQQDGKHH